MWFLCWAEFREALTGGHCDLQLTSGGMNAPLSTPVTTIQRANDFDFVASHLKGE